MSPITTAAQWKSGEIVQLPSGKVAKLRRPDALSLLLHDGRLPDALGPLIFGKTEGTGVAEIELTPESLTALVPILDQLAVACFVEPSVVERHESDKSAGQGDDVLVPSDIAFNDKLFLFQWVFGEAGTLAGRFPVESA
ncbi:MAG: hypothetical protein BroJett018_26470 [Chloroflexota bacterium]|nr:MAG: hypothetical protein BroJett018_26470 [Chloroflexota bacterium]